MDFALGLFALDSPRPPIDVGAVSFGLICATVRVPLERAEVPRANQ